MRISIALRQKQFFRFYAKKVEVCGIPRHPAGCQATTGWRQDARGLLSLRRTTGRKRVSRAAICGRTEHSAPRTDATPPRLPENAAPWRELHSHSGSFTHPNLRQIPNQAAREFKAQLCQAEGEKAREKEGERSSITADKTRLIGPTVEEKRRPMEPACLGVPKKPGERNTIPALDPMLHCVSCFIAHC